MIALPLGPLMVDIAGRSMTDEERVRLCHPLVGAVILFARNYASRAQLTELCGEIHALRTPRLLIAVDHEGGRVQRFRDGFTRLPAMRRLGELWDRQPSEAVIAAKAIGYLLAAELRGCGVDLSFTPVLDLDYGVSAVIGDRAFHRDPVAVAALAGALGEGLHLAGLAMCGKHFPGHGYVAADSHVAMPSDARALADMQPDLESYRRLRLDAVMPAHVVYPQVDSRPAGFSPVWLEKLRSEFSFDGVIFSDDLSMAAAGVAGDIVARTEAAWSAGCDMLLVCNAPDSAAELLQCWRPSVEPKRDEVRRLRVERLLPPESASGSLMNLLDHPLYQAGVAACVRLT